MYGTLSSHPHMIRRRGRFCFEILEHQVSNLGQGGYDVYAVARLINPNGDTIYVRSFTSWPNTIGNTDNDLYIGHPDCFELSVFFHCKDSSTLIVSGFVDPRWYGSFIEYLGDGVVVWNGDTLSYTVEMLDLFAGFFLLEVSGATYSSQCMDFTILVPQPEADTIIISTEVCLDECIVIGRWTPELGECIAGDTIMLCGLFQAPENDTAAFELIEVIVSLAGVTDTLHPEVVFDIVDGILCMKFDTIGIATGCYDLAVTLVFQSSGGNFHYMSYADFVEDPQNDLCFPLEPCCPELNGALYYQVILPFFGIESCEADVYKIKNGFIDIPSGYVYCDSLPVFEGGYLIWHSVVPYGSGDLQFTAHMYITDPELYESNEGLTGVMIVCDAQTGAQCPMKVHIPYVEPAEGLECVCNHCIEQFCPSPPCEYGPGDIVPITTCMFLQFPACDSCDVNPYELEIHTMGPGGTWIHSEYFYWDSTGIEQEECFTYYYRLPSGSQAPCYRLKLISGCGDYCEDFVCPITVPDCGIQFLMLPPIENGLAVDDLHLYPNPNREGRSVRIQATFITGPEVVAEIYTIEGRLLARRFENNYIGLLTMETQGMTSGTYLVIVYDPLSGERRYARYVHVGMK